MMVEYREYAIRMGKMPAFIQEYKSKGLPVQLKHLRTPVGFFTAETGEAPRFVHLWAFESLRDREEQRATLHDDPEWQAYVLVSHEYIVDMRVRFLNVLDFGSCCLLSPTVHKRPDV